MTYETPEALRMALEHRLNSRASETGIGIDRLRRRVIFERVVARLIHAEPGKWVLKGGMALEVRLQDRARLTKDIDLGLRDVVGERVELQERLVEALALDPFNDRFVLAAGAVSDLQPDGGGHLTWRSSVSARLAGRPFGAIQLDVSPRAHELERTDTVPLTNSLAFAAIEVPSIEIIDVNRHAAEKLHAMTRDFGDRENTRVRDLLDVVILIEHELLDRDALSAAVRDVWTERNGSPPPSALPPLPDSWPSTYERLIADHDLTAQNFPAALDAVTALWASLNIEES